MRETYELSKCAKRQKSRREDEELEKEVEWKTENPTRVHLFIVKMSFFFQFDFLNQLTITFQISNPNNLEM